MGGEGRPGPEPRRRCKTLDSTIRDGDFKLFLPYRSPLPDGHGHRCRASGGDRRQGARPGKDLNIIEADRGVTAGAGEGHLRLSAAVGVSSEHGWPLGPGPVAITPLHESEQDHPQLTTPVGQAILHAGPAPRLLVLRALKDSLINELGQLLLRR